MLLLLLKVLVLLVETVAGVAVHSQRVLSLVTDQLISRPGKAIVDALVDHVLMVVKKLLLLLWLLLCSALQGGSGQHARHWIDGGVVGGADHRATNCASV